MHSSVFTSSSNRSPDLKIALAERRFLVVGLCAAWCGTCGAFFRGFEALAEMRHDATFAWVDIEDDAEIAGDIDVENFPTIAVFRRGRLVHFGISLPQASILDRLLSSLDDGSATVVAHPAVSTLAARLSGEWTRNV